MIILRKRKATQCVMLRRWKLNWSFYL